MATIISLLLLVLSSTTFLSTCLAGEGENDTGNLALLVAYKVWEMIVDRLFYFFSHL